ncbi:MAG: single-stranded DNA-binding protein [Bacilli bacterium]|nr:single-stranded DNA-binding protein [Bacilli bacterium]
MLNQIVLVGRLTRDIVVNKSDNGTKVATISLAIPRSFKNAEGTYDTDFVDCTAFDMVAENTSEYCVKGDIVGVKGRVQSKLVEKDDKKENVLQVICEKVTFLSSKSKEEESE